MALEAESAQLKALEDRINRLSQIPAGNGQFLDRSRYVRAQRDDLLNRIQQLQREDKSLDPAGYARKESALKAEVSKFSDSSPAGVLGNEENYVASGAGAEGGGKRGFGVPNPFQNLGRGIEESKPFLGQLADIGIGTATGFATGGPAGAIAGLYGGARRAQDNDPFTIQNALDTARRGSEYGAGAGALFGGGLVGEALGGEGLLGGIGFRNPITYTPGEGQGGFGLFNALKNLLSRSNQGPQTIPEAQDQALNSQTQGLFDKITQSNLPLLLAGGGLLGAGLLGNKESAQNFEAPTSLSPSDQALLGSLGAQQQQAFQQAGQQFLGSVPQQQAALGALGTGQQTALEQARQRFLGESVLPGQQQLYNQAAQQFLNQNLGGIQAAGQQLAASQQPIFEQRVRQAGDILGARGLGSGGLAGSGALQSEVARQAALLEAQRQQQLLPAILGAQQQAANIGLQGFLNPLQQQQAAQSQFAGLGLQAAQQPFQAQNLGVQAQLNAINQANQFGAQGALAPTQFQQAGAERLFGLQDIANERSFAAEQARRQRQAELQGAMVEAGGNILARGLTPQFNPYGYPQQQRSQPQQQSQSSSGGGFLGSLNNILNLPGISNIFKPPTIPTGLPTRLPNFSF